ncbi:B12-binding domain-containing radical SAM protein [Candidatus Omnitrophota bacterium]
MRILFVYKMPSIDVVGPLGLLHIIAIAKQEGHECSLLVWDLERNFIEKAVISNPDIVCYSVTTGSEKAYLRINSLLKSRMSFFSIFGGAHPTFYPEFIENICVDSICRGESEQSFKELISRIEEGKNISAIPNFWFKEKGQIIKNELAPLIENLDSIPFPDRELIDKYFNYRAYGKINVITGRGCPFDCSYCFNHKLKKYYSGKGRYIRKRSVDNVLSEVKSYVAKYDIKEIYFVDDVFSIDMTWLAEFAEKYKKQINLPYCCHLRANLTTEKTVKKLKESNCVYVWLGIESGNPHLRQLVLNRDITDQQIYQASKWIKEYGLKLSTFNMIGLPGETIENAFETVQLNVKCRPDYAWVSMLQPYPDTELYNFSLKNNLLKSEHRIEANFHNSTPFKLKDEKQVENLHDFFAIAVNFKFLIPLIRQTIKLPKNVIFKIIRNVHKFYSYLRTGEVRLSYMFIRHLVIFIYVKAANFLLYRDDKP